MSTFTHATVIVADADKAAAQADLGEGFFATALSADGTEPATHWISSGPFNNDELNRICNDVAWPRKVYFGQDWQDALTADGLQLTRVADVSV